MKLVRAFLFLLLAAVLLYLAYPWLERTWYVVRLGSMPAPLRLPMPIAGLTPKALNDTWHAPRGSARRHEGIDIFARKGTPVLSTTEGIVIRRGENNLGGQVVWVLGPAGQRHYYAHLDAFTDVGPGDFVEPGTVLGYVGNTGNARTTPPHLHYGIYTAGGAINPYPLLAP
jgi:murein DD-endopeptidase MepM/ murein hydrolase activator NlpD